MSSSTGFASVGRGLSVDSTPIRDRDRDRLPFPQSAHPSPGPSLRQTTNSSASASFTNLPSTSSSSAASHAASQQAITVDSLLKQHASSPDPKGAALDQAVNDRNVLSAQNTQLWKLIEKQRSGYNQILKELERIRGERDGYKGKLAALAGGSSGTGDRRQKTSERATRPSLDTVSSQSASSTDHANYNPRQTMTRHLSDDAPTPRSSQHPPSLHSSRSHEPLSPRNRDVSLPSLGYSNPAPQRSNSPSPAPPVSAPSMLGTLPPSSARSSRPSPSPLVVPPRPDTLPVPSSAISSSPDTLPYSPNAGVNGVATRSATYSRKSSIADSVNSAVTSGSNTSVSTPSTAASSSINVHGYSIASQGPSSQPQQGPSTPQAASGFHQSITDELYSRHMTPTATFIPIGPSSVQAPPQIVTAPASAHSTAPDTQMQSQLLSTMAESKPHLLSRDSRISLPDEAKNYIANMVDSPASSPRIDQFTHKPKAPSSLATLAANGSFKSPRTSEFLDLEDDEEEDDEDSEEVEDNAEQTTLVDDGNDSPGLDEPQPRYSRDSVDPGSENEVVDPERPNPGHQHSSQRDDTRRKKDKVRAAAEDFPLPPPTSMHVQRQAFTAQESQSHAQNPQQLPSALFSSPSPTEMGDQQTGPSDSRSLLENPYSSQQKLVPASFRALPLLSSDLPHTTINVSHSFVRPNDRGKEVLSFVVTVNPGNGKDGWKVEKMYSDVLGLDQRVRMSVGKGVGKKIANLPEGKLWKDHAPAKVDQRKAVLENYLQTLINLPVKNNDEVIAFFTSDIVRETKQPVMQAGHKEGYLTKRGKNFGGWKTRYFVLSGPVLEYYDCRGGAHLGSITVTGAQIGRQQRTERAPATDEEKEYRHAFLIVEAKKGPGGNHPRHVLCAESDEDRDSWVEMLVRYFSGTYSEEPLNYGANYNSAAAAAVAQLTGMAPPRSSMSSTDVSASPVSRRPPVRGMSKDDISISKGPAVPISQLSQDAANAKLFQVASLSMDSYPRSSSPSKSVEPSPIDRQASGSTPLDIQNQSARRILERGQGLPSSLPDSSPLSAAQAYQLETSSNQRANSELGHYSDLNGAARHQRQNSPERHRARDAPQDGRKSFYPTLNPVISSPVTATPSENSRVPSPEKLDADGKVKISGPLNGAPIPSGFKFGGKDVSSSLEVPSSGADRREKAKSRSFWGFGKTNGDKVQAPAYPPRAVFGVPLEEALDVAQMCNLPAIVCRCIQYLEAKKAEQEEGIYRLSGSSAEIKGLKERFNTEGDVDLLASDEYWDPHAIAGLLKSFLRELPASILTRELHLRFLAVIDFVDAQERIKELSQLIAALPIANYSLLRALTAHLILIVQNSGVNKMTMRNVGIVFSPTLGIPAGVFSLMLGEFNRVFNVDADNDNDADSEKEPDRLSEPLRRNSRRYSEAAADQLLGLSGRTLKTSAEENQSDGDDFSVQDESGTETTDGDITVESASSSASQITGSAQQEYPIRHTPPETPTASRSSKAAHAASSRGLGITVTHSERGNRHSRMMGLPTSPRPSHSPSQPPEGQDPVLPPRMD